MPRVHPNHVDIRQHYRAAYQLDDHDHHRAVDDLDWHDDVYDPHHSPVYDVHNAPSDVNGPDDDHNATDRPADA